MSKAKFDHQKMAMKGNSSKRFFCVILTEAIESGNLELPRSFVEKHGKHLSNFATLKVPTGEESKMEIKRSKGQAWLHKGWAEFVVKYSIKCGYFLAFTYKGGSLFDVLIFGYTSLEIAYSPSSANACKLIEVKEEETDDEILDERPKKIQRVSGMKNGNLNRISARDRVMEKANAFQSSNPHFTVMMKPTSMSYLNIPAEHGRSYFGVKEGKYMMRLIGEDGRISSMNYIVGNPPRNRVRVYSGWTNFVKENSIHEGDVCLFELVNSSTMTFKVTLFRAAEHEIDANKKGTNKKDLLLVTTTTAAASCENKRVSSKISSTVMERVKNFKCMNPHFTFRVTSYSLSTKPKVHIPLAHSRKYLKNEDRITILDGSNGKKWLVYLSSRSNPTRVAIANGWKDFASANRLRVGDVLVFEMMNAKPKAYKANIFRAAS